jgi:hypothetical protein
MKTLQQIFDEGFAARQAGIGYGLCPYLALHVPQLARWWHDGWARAEQQAQRLDLPRFVTGWFNGAKRIVTVAECEFETASWDTVAYQCGEAGDESGANAAADKATWMREAAALLRQRGYS